MRKLKRKKKIEEAIEEGKVYWCGHKTTTGIVRERDFPSGVYITFPDFPEEHFKKSIEEGDCVIEYEVCTIKKVKRQINKQLTEKKKEELMSESRIITTV